MSEDNKAAVLSVLVDACAATEKDKAPGNAKLAWMTPSEIAQTGNLSEEATQDGLRRGVQEGLISEKKGKYALNDPKLNQVYTAN